MNCGIVAQGMAPIPTKSVMKSSPPLWYTVQAILGALLEQGLLVAAVLWLLPRFGIRLPLWLLAIFMLGLAVHSYIMYRVGKPTFSLKPRVAFENIIGAQGVVTRWQSSEGYVKVQGVLWKAKCHGHELKAGDEVVVAAVEGLRLVVVPKASYYGTGGA